MVATTSKGKLLTEAELLAMPEDDYMNPVQLEFFRERVMHDFFRRQHRYCGNAAAGERPARRIKREVGTDALRKRQLSRQLAQRRDEHVESVPGRDGAEPAENRLGDAALAVLGNNTRNDGAEGG